MDKSRKKEIIIRMIVEELRYTQFVAHLGRFNLEVESSLISMVEIIKLLMDVPEKAEEFVDTYVEALSQVREFPDLFERHELRPLAQSCYDELLECLEL